MLEVDQAVVRPPGSTVLWPNADWPSEHSFVN